MGVARRAAQYVSMCLCPMNVRAVKCCVSQPLLMMRRVMAS